MNPEDYVSYPLALALKKAGFDWECDRCYAKTDEIKHEFVCMTVSRDYNKPRDCEPPFLTPICSAVPLWQAQKWLREEWGIHINVCIYSDYSTDADGKVCDRWDFWGFDLYAVSGGAMMEDGDGEYDTYESALSAGIAAALELIENERRVI